MELDGRQSKTPGRKSRDESGSPERGVGSTGGRRWIWLVLSGFCFTVTTLTAFLQRSPDHPLNPSQTTWQWLSKPVEQNAWRRLPSLDNHSFLNCVTFAGERDGWAAGSGGTILATTDGGATWKLQNSSTLENLFSVYFADSNHGWAAGLGGTILATSDGGSTWKSQNSGISQDLESIYFTNFSHGWAVGDKGAILATSDGGATWDLKTSSTSQDLRSTTFADANHGWAVGTRGTILATKDGGTTWEPQSSGTSNMLSSVHFSDVSRGWAVGRVGTILATTDGGATWSRQTSGTSEYDLRSISFVDNRRGWALGDTNLVTSDGGVSWKHQSEGSVQIFQSAYFLDASRGWAVGSGGTMLETSDGGATWNLESIPALNSVYFEHNDHGWTAGDGGVILATNDGGTSWMPQTSGTIQNLASIFFLDASRGWAVGTRGAIVATSNGGTSWKPQTGGTGQNLESVFFSDASRGWAVGTRGVILTTSDGGASWKLQGLDPAAKQAADSRPGAEEYVQTTSSSFPELTSVQFADSNRGWVATFFGTILATGDGGATWNPQTTGNHETLYSLYFVDSSRGWGVGRGGIIIATSDGGSTWKPESSGTLHNLFSVYFVDSNHGWAAGLAGTILATNNGGITWKPQNSGTLKNLKSVHFSDVSHGWVVGNQGTLLVTSDGGQVWRGPNPPQRHPAPWYYVSLLLCLIFASLALRPETVLAPIDSAANRQVSDNPIGPGDLDALGLGEISLGLSQFFRNVDTKPPVTVGVLGEWGQGKSSVMRLLEADLKKNGVYPVWFNAWHYQKEDHLLAYLMEAIRKEAVPRLPTMQGLRFRARLLGLRASRGRWTFAGLVILLSFCAGLSQHPKVLGTLTERVRSLSKWPTGTAGQFTLFGLSIGAAILFLKQIYDALTAFHVNPAALIKLAAGSASIKDLGAKTDVRLSFAKEFSDVTRALAPYRMVIFIDDLDRCNPSSVTQILESVNFLTSAGDCFVVMGLAKPQVEASIGLSFKEVAEELGDEGDARSKRHDYAQQYLRKLINLEVKVPTATPQQQRVLLAGQAADQFSRPHTYAERLAGFARANRPIAWVLGTIVLASAGLWYGLTLNPEETARPVLTAVAQAPAAPRESEKIGTSSISGQNKVENSFDRVVPGVRETRYFAWLPVLLGLVLCGFGYSVLTRRPNEIIQDSRKFSKALEVWRPVIGRQYTTPREIKRFLNRVRYIAMRWRTPSLEKAPVERIVDWLQSKLKHAKPDHQEASEINEAGIVLMAALEGLGGDRAQAKDIQELKTEHMQEFGGLGEDWRRFRVITGEVN